MDLCVCYMTTGSREEALTIARALVSERLAACVNILDGMTSVYEWKGEIEEGGEVVVVAKTKEILMPELTERVRALHSYDCPCIVALPVTDGNPAFLEWIRGATRQT